MRRLTLFLGLSASVPPAQTYIAKAIHFSQLGTFSQQQLEDAAGLHAGASLTAADLSAAQRLSDTDYISGIGGTLDGERNAITVNFDLKPIDTAHLVAYTIAAAPGEQYRVKEITANNLDAAARANFDRGFLTKSGDLYNPEYIATFLKKKTALRAMEGYLAAYKAYADASTHTVDLVITFVRAAR